MHSEDDANQSLSDDIAQGRLTREQLLARGLGLGLSLSAIEALLAAGPSFAGGHVLAAPKPKRGGNLVVATRVGGTGDTLDPHHYATEADSDRVKALYNTLTHLDTTFKPRPGLAESWESNKLGTQWTFRLVKGATWHDGRPVTASDVAYSIKRIIDPKGGATAKDALAFIDPRGIKVLDLRTIRLNLRQPYVDMPATMGIDGTLIIPASFDVKKFPTAPIGSGPFKFRSFTPGKESTFVRNENYFHSGRPYVDQVQILNIFDETARNNAILSGQAHLATGIAFSSLKVLQSRGAQIFDIPGGTFVDISLVQDMKPFTDQRVRQAFALSLDRQEIVDVVFLGKARVGNDQPISSAYRFAPHIPQRTRDIPKAKALLAAAGYPKGIDVTLYTSDAGFAMVDMAVIAAKQAEEAGFKVSVKQWPPSSYWSEIWLKKNFYISWWSGHPTSDDLIHLTLTSKAPQNESHFRNAKFDALVAKARTTFSPSQRVSLYTQALRMVHDSASWVIPAYVDLLHGATKNFHWVEAPNSQISVYTDTAWLS